MKTLSKFWKKSVYHKIFVIAVAEVILTIIFRIYSPFNLFNILNLTLWVTIGCIAFYLLKRPIHLHIFLKETTHIKRGFINDLETGYYHDFGWGNGYVIIPYPHPAYGKHYDVINNFISVHGGLTYSERIDKDIIKYWGIDKKHKGKWMVGFDTLHYGDTLERWSHEEVFNETMRLKNQLKYYTGDEKDQSILHAEL